MRDRETREALFNFAYPERTTIEQIATAIARADGQPAPKLNLPLGAMMQASRVFEVAAKAGIKTGINPRAHLEASAVDKHIPRLPGLDRVPVHDDDEHCGRALDGRGIE